jgi:hypothetical protein
MNPVGYDIDGTSTMIHNDTIYNIPGNMYRKNGNYLNEKKIEMFSKMTKSNRETFMRNPEYNEKYIQSYNKYFSNHQTVPRSLNNGIDLNRNIGEYFDHKSSRENFWEINYEYYDETYPGYTQNSENETLIFKKIYNVIQPDLFVSIHCYHDSIIPSDVFMDIVDTTNEVIKYNHSKSVPGKYTLSNLLKDVPYFKSLINHHKHTNISTSSYEDTIKFPLIASPLGISRGEMTHWTYVRASKTNKTKFMSFTLELGNVERDGFYPNKYEMIDLVHNCDHILNKAMQNFDLVNTSFQKKTK